MQIFYGNSFYSKENWPTVLAVLRVTTPEIFVILVFFLFYEKLYYFIQNLKMALWATTKMGKGAQTQWWSHLGSHWRPTATAIAHVTCDTRVHILWQHCHESLAINWMDGPVSIRWHPVGARHHGSYTLTHKNKTYRWVNARTQCP